MPRPACPVLPVSALFQTQPRPTDGCRDEKVFGSSPTPPISRVPLTATGYEAKQAYLRFHSMSVPPTGLRTWQEVINLNFDLYSDLLAVAKDGLGMLDSVVSWFRAIHPKRRFYASFILLTYLLGAGVVWCRASHGETLDLPSLYSASGMAIGVLISLLGVGSVQEDGVQGWILMVIFALLIPYGFAVTGLWALSGGWRNLVIFLGGTFIASGGGVAAGLLPSTQADSSG